MTWRYPSTSSKEPYEIYWHLSNWYLLVYGTENISIYRLREAKYLSQDTHIIAGFLVSYILLLCCACHNSTWCDTVVTRSLTDLDFSTKLCKENVLKKVTILSEAQFSLSFHSSSLTCLLQHPNVLSFSKWFVYPIKLCTIWEQRPDIISPCSPGPNRVSSTVNIC